MPNYCSNALLLDGSAESLRKLVHDCDSTFSFNAFLPLPVELGDGSSPLPLQDAFNHSPAAVLGVTGSHPAAPSNYYEWRMINWGVKWDVSVDIDEGASETGQIVLHFDTAWRPPIAFCKALSVEYRDIKVELAFAECGMEYYGAITYRCGETDAQFRDVKVGADSLSMPFVTARLPVAQGAFWAEKPASMDECEWDDMDREDRLAPACAEHVDKYGIGLGG